MPDDIEEPAEEDKVDFKALRAKAQAADELAKQNAELNKRLVFADAGVDRNTALGKLLFATYEGDDPEDLKAKAAEVGYSFEVKLPEPEKSNGPAESDVRGLLSGGTPPDEYKPDALEEMFKQYHAARSNGMVRENAQYGLIDSVIQAGVNGDPRFAFNAQAWQEAAVQACQGEPVA